MSGIVGLLAGGGVSTLLSPVVNRLVDLIPDPVKRAEQTAAVNAALLAADQAVMAQQSAINLQEAKSESLFVSGWRPFIGWSCGAALLWQVLLAPFVRFNLALFGYTPDLPTLDTSWLTLILIPMLGLGTMRTVEKVQGVAGPAMGQPKPLPVPASVATADALLRVPPLPIPAAPPLSVIPRRDSVRSRDFATIDVLARTIWAEARGEGRLGMEAVAAVICRRAAYPRWWGNDIRSVCLAPSQFSCWLPGDTNRTKLQTVDNNDADFALALEIAASGVAGTLTDPTNGADSYANLAVEHPIWADPSKQTAVIGHHTFFRLET